MATYGSADGVKAIVPAAAPSGFSTSTTPTLAQVTTWLEEGYSIINQYLSSANYVVPVSASADAYPSLTALNNLYAAAYVIAARGLDVVQGQTENRSKMFFDQFYARLEELVKQDLTDLGVTLRPAPATRRRRIRSLQLRRVDGYSYKATGEAAE